MNMVIVANSIEALLAENDEQTSASVTDSDVLGHVRNMELEDLKTLKISRYAFDKMLYTLRQAFKVKGSAVESYWLLVGDTYVKDILIPEQSASHGYVSVSERGILKISKLIQENQIKIMGWGHSHADFGVFFSGTDRGNQMTVFYETTNYIKNSKGELIKYCYGSTYNIHEKVYAVLSYQFKDEEVRSVEISHEIIDDGCRFDPNSEKIDLSKLLMD
jgi:hypothetical protein